jgi:hypothetical protein
MTRKAHFPTDSTYKEIKTKVRKVGTFPQKSPFIYCEVAVKSVTVAARSQVDDH